MPKLEKLKPCPLCGCEKIDVYPQEYGFLVKCFMCDLQKPVVSKYKRSVVISWNRRFNEKGE